MKIELTAREHDYLRSLVGMDKRLKIERNLNAGASNNRHFSDPDMFVVDGILEALGKGQLENLLDRAFLEMEIIGPDKDKRASFLMEFDGLDEKEKE